MARKYPLSDTEFRAEQPQILRYLEKQHYRSAEWSRDAGIKDKDRGLGNVEIDGAEADVYQIDQLPTESRKGRI